MIDIKEIYKEKFKLNYFSLITFFFKIEGKFLEK